MTNAVPDLNTLLQGGGSVVGAFNKHSQVKDTVSGEITEIKWPDHMRDYMTGEPEYWDDAKTQPKYQIRVTLQADPGTWTPQSEQDAGLRSMYIKSWGIHLKTFKEAMDRAGSGPEVGGHLTIRFDREEPSKQGSPTKIYEYEYKPPQSALTQFLNSSNQQPQAQQPQQGYQQPQQFSQQQQPVAPVANVHTQQGQVDPQTGEIVGQAAPVQPVAPAQAQQPQQAAVDPWTGQPTQQAQPQQAAPQQTPAPVQQPAPPQAAPQTGPAPGAGMDSAIMKLVQAGLDDNTILATLGAQGVTAQQVAEVRAASGQ